MDIYVAASVLQAKLYRTYMQQVEPVEPDGKLNTAFDGPHNHIGSHHHHAAEPLHQYCLLCDRQLGGTDQAAGAHYYHHGILINQGQTAMDLGIKNRPERYMDFEFNRNYGLFYTSQDITRPMISPQVREYMET
ncbi:MAG: hypothetical protein L6R42_007247 [Xanthoria sp. 1 TBL-2021]|nr:MAG: hypothetical protein L6R42_007247 [Xanthoria sp. 1 TBL-2021]